MELTASGCYDLRFGALRLYPIALLPLARPCQVGRPFSKHRLAAVKEMHTPGGKHKLLVTPFSKWVPNEVLRAAQKLTEKETASQLAVLLRK